MIVFLHSEKETSFDGYGKSTLTNGGVANSPNIFVADNTNELRDLRQLTPPLPFTVRGGQVCINFYPAIGHLSVKLIENFI